MINLTQYIENIEHNIRIHSISCTYFYACPCNNEIQINFTVNHL